MDDLEKSIETINEVVALTSLNHPDRAERFSNLGCHLTDRFAHFGALNDLEQAIHAAEVAIAATPPGHPSRASRLGNLGNMLDIRFGRLGNILDLDKALQMREMADLENAIYACEEAAAVTPLDYPDYGTKWRIPVHCCTENSNCLKI
ncbi:hypothetical protein Q9L58_006669 [Maublancomyces gigas]|uniref:Uncharacterized protein n=1 Tax=Discina gigas TaxID=1032678 RepID=A0ABR3GFV6_9PEZI